jgi:hypothetical protein
MRALSDWGSIGIEVDANQPGVFSNVKFDFLSFT